MREDTRKIKIYYNRDKVSIPARMREDTSWQNWQTYTKPFQSPRACEKIHFHSMNSNQLSDGFNPRTHARRYHKYAQEIPMRNICCLYNKPKIKICQPLNLKKSFTNSEIMCIFILRTPRKTLFLSLPYSSNILTIPPVMRAANLRLISRSFFGLKTESFTHRRV